MPIIRGIRANPDGTIRTLDPRRDVPTDLAEAHLMARQSHGHGAGAVSRSYEYLKTEIARQRFWEER